MRRISYAIACWIMIALVAIETACGTYFRKNNLELLEFTSLTFTISGLLIALFPLFRYPSKLSLTLQNGNTPFQQIFIVAFFIGLLGYAFPHIYWIFDFIKIDYHNADMIPQIIVSCRRWLSGNPVYDPIPEIWNGMLPTYLPLMWMPYAPLLMLNMDVRWTGVLFYLCGIGLILWVLARESKVNWPQLLLILLLLGNMVFMQTDYNRIFFAWTPEGTVVAYYIMLGFALTKKNPWFTGIAITCCLLSRYALFFWIPAYLLFTFFSINRKRALIEAGGLFVLTVIIFILPYFLKDPAYFLTLPKKYSGQVEGFWYNSQKEISQSLGLAKYFLIDQFQFLHNLQLGLAVVIPAFFYLLMYRFRNHESLNLSFAGLCGLKFSLTFFYSFLEAPYFYYLYMVPILFSYPILLYFLNPQSQIALSAQTYGKQE